MYEIERDIPIPTSTGRSKPVKYPFEKMFVGHSFAVPVPFWTPDTGHFSATVRSQAYQWGKKNGREFKVRLSDDKASVRVWRTA